LLPLRFGKVCPPHVHRGTPKKGVALENDHTVIVLVYTDVSLLLRCGILILHSLDIVAPPFLFVLLENFTIQLLPRCDLAIFMLNVTRGTPKKGVTLREMGE
jgi:hypothetical protein